jgi:aminopeptidase
MVRADGIASLRPIRWPVAAEETNAYATRSRVVCSPERGKEGSAVKDPRIDKLASILVRYSLLVKKGEWIVVRGPYLAEDLLRAVFREVLAAGGHPTLNVEIPGQKQILLSHASENQIKFLSPVDNLEHQRADKLLYIWASWNSKELTEIDRQKMVILKSSRSKLMNTVLNRMTKGGFGWCATLFPTQSAAQDAEMGLDDFEDFVFSAGKLNARDPVEEWRKMSARQANLVKILGRLETVRIVGEGTDLTLGVAGRTWVNCDGRINFPDGEVFTGPVENSAEGQIRYSFPAVFDGREVENVRLTFKRGKVVDASAGKGEDLLHAMLDTDPGARRIGELAFGTNYSIKRFTKNTLFDEKIGGTMHIAIGASLPFSGGRNKSALHWDMVCDTRKGFTVYGDGKPIHRNGKFLIG